MMSMGGMLKYFILPERKQKINTETVRQKNIVGVVLSCLLPSITLCVLGIWFLPTPEPPHIHTQWGELNRKHLISFLFLGWSDPLHYCSYFFFIMPINRCAFMCPVKQSQAKKVIHFA